MALIKCTECGKEISDKANSCIYCGCPIEQTNFQLDKEDYYKFCKTYLFHNSNQENVICICPKCNMQLTIPKDIIYNKEFDGYKTIFRLMDSFTCNCGFSSDMVEEKIKQYNYEENVHDVKIDTSVKCPKCGSTQIQMVPRKWSLMTGLLTNKVDRVCVNCKHKF